MFCMKCGCKVSDDALFCPRCGASLAPSAQGPQSEANHTICHAENAANAAQKNAPNPEENSSSGSDAAFIAEEKAPDQAASAPFQPPDVLPYEQEASFAANNGNEPETSQDGSGYTTPPSRPKTRAGKWIALGASAAAVVAVVCVVFVSGLGSALYINTFRPAKDQLLYAYGRLAETKSSGVLENTLFQEAARQRSGSAFTADSTLQVDLGGEEQAGTISGLLSRLSLTTVRVSDPQHNASSWDLGLLIDGQEQSELTASVVQTDEALGVKLPFYEQMLYASYDDIETYVNDTFHIDVDLSDGSYQNALSEFLDTFDWESWEQYRKKYSRIFTESLDPQDFALESADVVLGDETVRLKQITFETTTARLLDPVLEAAAQDAEFQDFLYDELSRLMETDINIPGLASDDLTLPTANEFRSSFGETMDDLRSELARYPLHISLTTYMDNLGDIKQIELEISDADAAARFCYTGYTEAGIRNTSFKLYGAGTEDLPPISLTVKSTEKEGIFRLEWPIDYGGADLLVEGKLLNSSNQTELTIDGNFFNTNMDVDFDAACTAKRVSSGYDYDCAIGVDSDGIRAELAADGTVSFSRPEETPQIEADAVDVGAATFADWENIISQMQENLAGFALSNQDLFS